MDKYYFEENEKDKCILDNLNYKLNISLQEILTSNVTDSEKIKNIESMFDLFLKEKNKLKPYNLYKNTVLIEGQNNYK